MTSALLGLLIAFFEFGGPGTTVLPLLRAEQGVRAAALGGSYVGRADDAAALYWNPAGLGRVRRYHFTASHHEWFGGIRDEHLQVVFPGRSGAFALGLLYSAEPGIERWTPANTPGDTFSTWTSVLALGYGLRFADRWRLGMGIKGIYSSLHTITGYGGALDLGLGYRPLPELELGLVGRNFGLLTYGNRWRDLPAEAAFGASWTRGRFNLGADLALPLGCPLLFRTGIEYQPADVLLLRLGYRTGPADLATLGALAGLTGGIGLALGPMRLDYALSPHGPLGLVHRLGLDFSFRHRGSGRVLIRTVTGPGLEPVRARLSFDGVGEGSVLTDRFGRYELTGLLPGRLVIRTSLPGYVTREDTMHILGDRLQHATLELRLMEYGSIWVAINDAATGQAIGGTVNYRGPVLGEQEIPANPGSAAIRDLPVGSYIITADHPDPAYIPFTCTLDVRPGAVTERRLRLQRQQ